MQTDMTINATRQPVVVIVDGEAIATSRDVAAYFEKRHDDVLRAIRGANCSADFRARNFAETQVREVIGATARLSPVVNMTRNGFAFVAMGFTGAKAGAFKEAYILQFDAMEAELRRQTAPSLSVPQTLPEALRLAADLAEQNVRFKSLLLEARPKLDALDRIATAKGSLCITDAAKALQMQPKALFGFLRANRWIYRRAGTRCDRAFEDKRQAGLLEHKVTEPDEQGRTFDQVRVTPKGLAALASIFARRPLLLGQERRKSA